MVQNAGCREQKDCPSTTQHSMSVQSQGAHIKKGTSGSQKDLSNSRYSHSITDQFKSHIFERLKFRIAVFLTYLIKGHYKNPKRQLNQH